MKTKADYLEYLKSGHWAELRLLALKRDRFQCVECAGTKHLEVHHRFYRDRWEDAMVGDLKTLCSVCHEREHRSVPVSVEIGVAGSIGGRRWNILGQLVTRKGIPIQAIIRRQKKQRNEHRKKWVKNRRKNRR